MNKRISLGAAIAFVFIVAAATFSMTMIYSQRSFNERVSNLKQREVTYDKFTELDRVVRDHYYGVINEAQLLDAVAQGYIQGIGDKYARYIPVDEFARMNNQDDQAENAGIGAVVEAGPDGYLFVVEVYPDSPAYAAGMQEGDLIVKIDDTDLTVENAEYQLGHIYGVQGTRIILTTRRGGEEYIMDITRRAVVPPTVYSHIIEGTETAYIQIKEFASGTSDQFNRELDRMLSAGARSIIFDLRDNKGGVIRQATRMLDRLVPPGILYTSQRKDGTVEEVRSDGNAIDLPMAVLINQNTASAAELFAVVLKDYDRARLVGNTTAGKGVVQEIIRLTDGSAVELTTAYYHPPISLNFDGEGITPDFEVIADEGVMILDDESDMQLQKAMEVVTTAMAQRENQQALEQEQEEDGEE